MKTSTMYRESSSELDDLDYRCPKCPRSFTKIQSLRDHLDLVHLHKPTRDTDDEQFMDPILESLRNDRLGHPLTGVNSLDPMEMERKLHLAKELELRHKILHRHSQSRDELKTLNGEILSAKQRQYEMCHVIQSAREQIDGLRQSAEKVTHDQQAMIDQLQEELQIRDKQLNKASAELRELKGLHQHRERQVRDIMVEKDQNHHVLEELSHSIQAKERQIQDKQREVENLKEFIKNASQKEINARQKLEQFINSLLDRTETAENQVRLLRKQLSVTNLNPDNLANRGVETPVQRSQSAGPVLSPRDQFQQIYPPVSSSQAPHFPSQRSAQPTNYRPPSPRYHPQPMSPAQFSAHSPGVSTRPTRGDTEPYANGYMEGDYGKSGGPRRVLSKGEGDRPESGYGSIRHPNSRPHSTLSSVSEHSHASTDTVVPAYNHQVAPPHSRDPYSDTSDLELTREFPVDENGILWDSPDGYDSASIPSKQSSLMHRPKPRLQRKMSLDPLFSRVRGSPRPRDLTPPLTLSRMSSMNSAEKLILGEVKNDTKFEIQRYKFLLRDRLKMLKEQEKLARGSDGFSSDSELTSVTEDSLTSLTFTSDSGSESELDSHRGRNRRGSRERRSHVPGQTSPGKPMRRVLDRPDTMGDGLSSDLDLQHPVPRPTVAPPVVDALTQQRRNVLFLIFLYLDTVSLQQMALVCREWREVSRHPALWRNLVLRKGKVDSKFLVTLSKWCTEAQYISMEGLRARSKKSFETYEEYKRKTRGSLEEGLDALLRASQNTLTSLKVVDCGNILTDRCLWLASCYCRLLQRVTYISDSDPVGPEVIWSLGAGCREITSLIVPPLYPKKKLGNWNSKLAERADKFTSRCVQMISWCWPELRVLAIGGKNVNSKALVAVARNCSLLRRLELHKMPELTEEIATMTCHAGLRNLETLDITFTPVTAAAVKHFISSCTQIKSLKVRVGISDYFTDISSKSNKKKFDDAMKALELLKKNSTYAKVLSIQTDVK